MKYVTFDATLNLARHFLSYYGGMETLDDDDESGRLVSGTHNKDAWECMQRVADMVIEICHKNGNDDLLDAVCDILPGFGI